QGPREVTQPMIAIRMETADGRAAHEILQIASRESVDLIVLAAHTSPDRQPFCLGGTEGTVATHAHESLLLVRADSESGAFRGIDRLLVLLDGSVAAESSLPTALELARNLGAEILLAQVSERPVLPSCEPLAA